MDERSFWKLIELVERDALADDEDAAVEPLIVALSRLPATEIAAFEELLAQQLYSLDGRRYAVQAGESSGSADGFLYARCFVVAQGERHFRCVRSDPTLMPKTSSEWCEALLGVASTSCERATGEPREFETSVSYETGSNQSQWA